MQPYAMVIGVATLMHLLSGMLGLTGYLRWIFAIAAPTVVAYAYHLWWLDYIARNKIHYPIFLTSTSILILNLMSFTIAFAVVSCVMHYLFPRAGESNVESTD